MVISDGFNSIINYISLLSYFVLLLINIINKLCVLDSLINGLLINYLINFVVILIYLFIKVFIFHFCDSNFAFHIYKISGKTRS